MYISVAAGVPLAEPSRCINFLFSRLQEIMDGILDAPERGTPGWYARRPVGSVDRGYVHAGLSPSSQSRGANRE
eukprot:6130399-Pyramimonas_sp.AAC.1